MKTQFPSYTQNNEREEIAISIVVPVYNMEKYLRQMIESVLTQTFTDFELILVENGSTDSSPQIIEDYVRQDDRIKLLKVEVNNGPNPARNLGLQSASGRWIMLMDSDDMLHPNGLNSLIEVERQYSDADFIKGSHTVLFEDGREIETKFATSRRAKAGLLMSGGEFLKEIIQLHGVYFAAIFSSKLIRQYNIQFNELITANGIDDQPFLIQTMLYGKGVYVDAPIYKYRMFLQSTSNTVRPSERVIKADLEAIKEFRYYMDLADNQLLRSEIERFYVLACVGTLKHIMKSSKDNRKYWLKSMKDIVLHLKGYDKQSKIMSLCYNYFPFLVRFY